MRSPLIRTAAGAGLVLLTVTGVAATRSPAEVAGGPTLDRATVAEATFPYPHVSVDRSGDQAVLTLDDGTVAPGRSMIYQVPADGSPAGAGVPVCDMTDLICWSTTTVDAGLRVRIELDYLAVPCVIAGSPTTSTTVDCHG